MIEFLSDGLFYYCLFNIVFYTANLLLYIIDTNSIFSGRKLQAKSVDEIVHVYKKCLPVALLNTFVYNLPAVITLPPLINILNFEFSWLKMIHDLIASYILMDLFYYLTHRLLHTDRFYTKFHKKHHEITAPVGLTSTYLTFVDFYSNVLSIYVPPIILSAHSITMSLWIIISTLNTIFIGHSGFSPIARFHDNHHKYFNCNYGVGIFADRLFGTAR